jgi:hypothetical protein
MIRCFVTVAFALLLAACGGGGGKDCQTDIDTGITTCTDKNTSTPAPAPTPTLSTAQKNFEAAALSDYWYKFYWSLPSTNVAPTSGTHYIFADKVNSPASPSLSAQNEGHAVVNLASTLALPAMTQVSVIRVLRSGVIYLGNHDSKATWSYSGNDVVQSIYATDGITILNSVGHDDWSAPIPLSGQINSTPIVKSFLGFTKLTTQTLNFDFNQPWLPGSTYFTRKAYQKNDTLFLYDCSGSATYTAAVTACSGTATTIEGYFASSAVANAGGVTIDGVLYNLGSGTIGTLEGARAWIANAKRPTSANPTDSYLTFVELNGKIYYGFLTKAGTREKFIDGVDATIINDYTIRLNSTAGSSLKAAIKF